jgi:non-canonical purine NTP pyrophosphatase (RdgB/HAM1 family)
MKTITLVTGNANKLRELQALVPDSLKIIAQSIDLPEIQSLDVREVVEDKVRRAYQAIKAPVIVEDVATGLDGLGGLPGPFFKFFEKTLGKRALLVIAHEPEPKVTIRCVAAFYDGKQMLSGEGIIHGRAVEPRRENGFGFDFTVVPEGETRTMAEMSMEEKNAISHRGQAFRHLIRQIEHSRL